MNYIQEECADSNIHVHVLLRFKDYQMITKNTLGWKIPSFLSFDLGIQLQP